VVTGRNVHPETVFCSIYAEKIRLKMNNRSVISIFTGSLPGQCYCALLVRRRAQ